MKPHGPVSERFMRHYYGAKKGPPEPNWRDRYIWLKANALFDNSWMELSSKEFDARVDAFIAREKKP